MDGLQLEPQVANCVCVNCLGRFYSAAAINWPHDAPFGRCPDCGGHLWSLIDRTTPPDPVVIEVDFRAGHARAVS